MSIIIAGDACKRCGQKYFLSLGHLKWFDDWAKRKKKSPQIKRYFKIVKSGLCPACITGYNEFWVTDIYILKRIEYGRTITRRTPKRRIIRRRNE